MVAADALHGAGGIGTGGSAVDDDFGDCSHFFVGLMGLMGFFAIFDFIQRCSRPFPAVRQEWAAAIMPLECTEAFLWAAMILQHTKQ
jgi:hypothetical protein